MNLGTMLLLVTLLILVLSVSRLGFGKVRFPFLLGPLVDTGVIFVLLGALIGPQGLNIFTEETFTRLNPLVIIAIGWIGFLYGSHFEWRLMRRYPVTIYLAAFTQAFVTFALVAVPAYLFFNWFLAETFPFTTRLSAAFLLGICASGTAPAGVFRLAQGRKIAPQNLRIMRFISAVDDLPAVVMLGILYSFFHPTNQGFVWWQLVPISFAMGPPLGLIAHWLFPREGDARLNALVLLGVISLGAGGAELLGLSPLFVTVAAGLTFANLSTRKENAYGLLARREHTLYLVFMVVAGMLFRFEWSTVYLMVPVFLLLRTAGKILGGYLGWQLFLMRSRTSPLIGSGLLFQGGMTLVIAIGFEHTHSSLLAHQVTTTIVIAVVFNELFAPLITGLFLGKKQ